MKIKSTPYIVVYFIGGQHVVVLPFEEFPNGIGSNGLVHGNNNDLSEIIPHDVVRTCLTCRLKSHAPESLDGFIARNVSWQFQAQTSLGSSIK